MLKHEEISITEEFGNMTAPHQMRIRHIPTGIEVMGNTGSENAKDRLRADLLAKLESCIPDAMKNGYQPPASPQSDMQAQLDDLKAMVRDLLNRQNPNTYIDKKPEELAKAGNKAPDLVPKRRGRPPKVKAQTVEVTAPEGYSVLDPSKVHVPATVQTYEQRSFKAPVVVTRGEIT
jgi:hypothetical protein